MLNSKSNSLQLLGFKYKWNPPHPLFFTMKKFNQQNLSLKLKILITLPNSSSPGRKESVYKNSWYFMQENLPLFQFYLREFLTISSPWTVSCTTGSSIAFPTTFSSDNVVLTASWLGIPECSTGGILWLNINSRTKIKNNIF